MLIYDVHEADVGSTTVYTLPLAHRASGAGVQDESLTCTHVTATLMHVRYVQREGGCVWRRRVCVGKEGVWVVLCEVGMCVGF